MGYFWEEFEIGDRFQTEKVEITEALVSQFANLTGDDNPFHISQNGVKDTPYEKPIAHGMLIMSLFVGLNRKTGILKGTSLGVIEVNWQFRRPVYVGDELYFLINIEEKKETSHKERGVLKRKIIAVNHYHEEVGYGIFVNLVKRK